MARAFPALRVALSAIVIVALCACANIVRHHGYTPSDEELALITVGKDTHASVGNKVGRPSAGGLMGDSGWYYVQSRWVERGAFAPKETDRQVLAISFNEKGVVSQIERFGLENGRVVELSRRVTDSNISSVGFVRQMLSNLGRFNAGQFLDGGKPRGRLE